MADQGSSSKKFQIMNQRNCPNFPPELEDDEQAAVLYSPFREKSLNPRSWIRKMTFWQTFLLNIATKEGIVSFDMKTLPLMFERKGMTPKCLPLVVEDLKRNGKLKTYDEYNKTQSWLSWGFNSLVKQPLLWSASHLLGSPKKTDIFVWPHVVQNIGEKMIENHHSHVQHEVTDCVISLANFRRDCLPLIPREQDFNIVLSWLERNGRIKLKELEDGQNVVKVCKKGETQSEDLTETDINVYRIKETERRLEDEVELLSSRMNGYLEEAQSYVKQKQKSRALHCLRKKKMIQHAFDRKSSNIIKLQEIIIKIEEARTNEMVIKACETAVGTLKSLTAETNLDKVETVMDQVQESLEDHKEISDAMLLSDSTDYEDLEAELQELITNDDVTKVHDDSMTEMLSALTVDDLGLPDVPSQSPSRSIIDVKSNHRSSMLPS